MYTNPMGHTKERSRIAIAEDAIKEAKHICEDFAQFTEGTRALFLCHRSKDGATHSSRHWASRIANNPKEFQEQLAIMIEDQILAAQSGDNLRIYTSVNSRDVDKAIHTFKIDQLDADYNKDTARFYMQLKDRFVSCLMRPASRASKYFLFDIDEPMTLDDALRILDGKCEIIKQYKTKNGWHIVTEPFNYTELPVQLPINKDGLLLLRY